MCKAPLQVALSSLSPVLCFLALPHVVLEAAGWVVVAVTHNLYETRRPSCAMSHEFGVNTIQLFTKSLSVIYSINSLSVIHPLIVPFEAHESCMDICLRRGTSYL